jgi:hypothetical protein
MNIHHHKGKTTMDEHIYAQALDQINAFINQKKADSDLYHTWTQHTSTAGKVLIKFQSILSDLGIATPQDQQPYVDRYKEANGIGDNYYA